MKTVQIGDRKTKDLKEQELIDFMYDFGYCCSSEYFGKPIMTHFEYDEMFDTIFFNYHQIRNDDGFKIEDEGSINLTDNVEKGNKDDCSIFIKRFRRFPFNVRDLRHFIKLGFDIPI